MKDINQPIANPERPIIESDLAGAERIALDRPVREVGSSFDVPIMEQIANPGGQAYEGPVATMDSPRLDMLDMVPVGSANTTSSAVDDAVASMRRAAERNYSPSPADKNTENLMDAILADQVRDRNFRTVQNLARRAAADSLANKESHGETRSHGERGSPHARN